MALGGTIEQIIPSNNLVCSRPGVLLLSNVARTYTNAGNHDIPLCLFHVHASIVHTLHPHPYPSMIAYMGDHVPYALRLTLRKGLNNSEK